MYSRNRKESAYTSMKLSNNGDFQRLLSQTKNKEEQNFAQFLLAYNSFNNEIPAIEKIFTNDSSSDLTKVLVARAINEIERNYLPYSINCFDDNCQYKSERLPFYHKQQDPYGSRDDKNHLKNVEQFIIKAKNKTNDDFWKISLAYLQFLQGNHQESDALLSQIKTKNTLYQYQIKCIQLLNEIVSQPTITAKFEDEMLQKYPSFFSFEKEKKYN